MLILSRERSEKIIIGTSDNRITVMLVDIRGDKARIGVEAPATVPVHRHEVYEAIHRKD